MISHYEVRLGHALNCNGRAYTNGIKNLQSKKKGRNYKVAGCVVCEDSEGRYLISRRERRMKAWPKAWVFPGGHIEVDEALDEGSLRECYEEVGIEI